MARASISVKATYSRMADEAVLLPLRMVNEFVYCPRLFWLEFVARELQDNAETVDGRRVHRNVDRPSNAEIDIGETRSVTMSSDSLGLIGTLDLVESDGTSVIPVDYKRGKVPQNAFRAYDPERVQLCLQVLLLREAGFTCDRGILYYAASRSRVEVVIDDELVALSLSAVRDARTASTLEAIPSPLEDSPKCPRCSLVNICLPDETNALRRIKASTVRPLVVPLDVAAPLYVL